MTEADSERRRRFDALFREHVAGVASFCRWRSHSHSDADDAVAEVFWIAWRRLDDVPVGAAARAWLYATARRVMANQARANTRRSKLIEKLGAQAAAAAGDFTLASADDPLNSRVQDVLVALSPRDREILLLAEWEGLTPAEIAGVIHAPAVTVRVRLHRARRRFRAVFESRMMAASASAHASVSPRLDRCEP